MLAVAAALTFAPVRSDHFLRHLAAELSEWGVVGWRLAQWLGPRLTRGIEIKAALLAWLDGTTTLIEGILLFSGKAWGEWLVVAGLALLIPIEAVECARRPSLARAAVLAVNALAVAYLARRRLRAADAPSL